jgi:hypothetical protein
MPVHTNKISDFEFLGMEGTIYSSQQQKELLVRPGVDGTGARKLGKLGKPFQIVTTNYEVDFFEAANKMEQYIDLCDSDPVLLMRYDVPYGNFIVLEVVEAVPPYAIFPSIGGIQPDPGNPVALECCHIVVWTLVE